MQVEDENKINFHMAEFNALKTEVAELVRSATENLRYALVTAGAIFAWMATHKPGATGESLITIDVHVFHVAWWLPFLLSLFFFAMVAAIYFRILDIAAYLQKLEEKFAADGLGWEEEFKKRPPTFASIHVAAWIALLFGTLLIAILNSCPS